MLKPKLLQQEQGFTLVEVLVAILITTLFVGIAMQSIVFAAIFKVKAQEYAEATTWIQEDLEDVKYKATILQLSQTTLANNAAAEATSITANGNIFAVDDTLKVGLDPTIYKVTSVTGTGTTRTLTISPTLGTAQLQNAAVVATKMCNPAAQNAGLADALRDWVTDTDHSNGITNITSDENFVNYTKNFRIGKAFIMSRNTTLSADFPHTVLKVSYSVAPQNAHTTLAQAASVTSTTLSVSSASGFKPGDKLTVGTDTDNQIQSIFGNTITLKAQLGSTQALGSIVDASVATINTEVIPNVAFQCP